MPGTREPVQLQVQLNQLRFDQIKPDGRVNTVHIILCFQLIGTQI